MFLGHARLTKPLNLIEAGRVKLHKDNETTDDTPSIITGDTYNLYLDTSVLQLGQTYVLQLQMRQKHAVSEYQ